MNDGKSATSRYVIFGAGAVGSAIAALLTQIGRRAVCVARPIYAKALIDGITIRADEGDLTVKVEAVTSVGDLMPESDDVAFITTKSQATETAVKQLLERYDRTLPVVCLQNGVRNEEIAAREFDRVYAGLVFFSAVQLEPSVITMPQGRIVTIGCYPTGVDDLARFFCSELGKAGFETMASSYVMSMKWGKLVANLNNATTTITGYWLERAMADPDMRKLMLAVREEGLRVLDAAGIAVEPPADEPSPIRILEMTKKLSEPLRHPYNPEASADEPKTYSSMWQDLHLGRKAHEAEFLNGDIIALGKKVGIATPYSSMLLRIINEMFANGVMPGRYTPRELENMVSNS